VRPSHKAIPGGVLLSALLLAGCGSGVATGKNPPAFLVRSPVIDGHSLPARYTCDGRNIAPPLEWGTVPPGTGSLVLFVVGLTPKPGTESQAISVEWAVAGLPPELHKLPAGRLPRGAYVGISTDGKRGYSICPPKGQQQIYQFELYGLPPGATLSRDFAGLSVLSGLAPSGSASPATARGGFVATYKRT
jgi:phosphatidylethanolamine-binding protein (PEBP) family uncharacterized protein